ncbi:MAG: hypothetical protein ACOYLU_14720, partial [Limisphaerales bacterium]
ALQLIRTNWSKDGMCQNLHSDTVAAPSLGAVHARQHGSRHHPRPQGDPSRSMGFVAMGPLCFADHESP